MTIAPAEKLDLLCQTRNALLIAAEFIRGDSPFSRDAVLRELEDAVVMATAVILAEKHPPEARRGQPQP